MRRDDADVEQLHSDIEILRTLIGANLERPPRRNYILRACLDVLSERRQQLEKLERAIELPDCVREDIGVLRGLIDALLDRYVSADDPLLHACAATLRERCHQLEVLEIEYRTA